VPFWLGEAPSRTWELSEEVSRLRHDLAAQLEGEHDAAGWLVDACDLDRAGATQVAEYIAAERGALGVLPTQDDVVFERFFDDAGGM
jgi:ATP-dependent Lhr-like helicase